MGNLMVCRNCALQIMPAIQYHSPSARTQSSLSFSGLELELERNWSEQFDKLKIIIKALVFIYYMCTSTCKIKLMGLLPHQLAQDLLLVAVKRRDDYQIVTHSGLHSLNATRIM